MALVLALVVLFLMSLIGGVVATTSTTEIKVSGKYKQHDDAFYTAERVMEYSISDSAIYTTIGTGSVGVPLTGINLSSANSTASGTVQYVSSGNPPRGSGADITQFKANYFQVNVTGIGTGGSNASLERNVAKIVPKE